MTEIAVAPPDTIGRAAPDLIEFVERLEDGVCRINFSVPDAYCAACIDTIERGLGALDGVRQARVNLTRRTVQVDFAGEGVLRRLPEVIRASGYRNHPVDARDLDGKDPVLGELLRALAVAAFATLHVMFFSEAVWNGDPDPTTRQLFHWISALVALPATVYAGRIFFRSAWAALSARRSNMDVPIAVGLIATCGISLFETIRGGEHAYFDASTMLLLFLLAGRTLEHVMRSQARSVVTTLARLAPRGAQVIDADGSTTYTPLDRIQPGMELLLRPGDRVPADSVLRSERAELDLALVTGEPLPVQLETGASLPAGATNLGFAARVEAVRPASDSFLARAAALMEAAEGTRTRYRRIADRAASWYGPVIYFAAATTFLGWGILGGGWHAALVNAVAVLIVTCPCALALAVPMVHVIAAERLLRQGIVMRDGAALERLTEVRAAAFDKTGTLTEGRPSLAHTTANPEHFAVAARLAASSNHPLSRAIVAAHGPAEAPADVQEHPGAGVEAEIDGTLWRLGSPAFCGASDTDDRTTVWLARDGRPVARFTFDDRMRPETPATAAELRQLGLDLHVLSGDAAGPVIRVAEAIGADCARAQLNPAGKVEAVNALRDRHGAVVMIGDGINDAAALRAADVSFAPAAAADVGRAAADFVLTRDRLDGVPFAIRIARSADRLVRQNLALSLAYNLVVLPLAMAGLVTPLIAAVAMSSSSILVVLNALRLRLERVPSDNAGVSA
ncbi:heavy metal translocating P-type ATPase [Devosia albogilva]|uniref:Heavy metal translocating P-type ATPase n=1 Tax=Devosia albogilva TaxID=429726 RepID=A0ABW5QHN1_9HYPH